MCLTHFSRGSRKDVSILPTAQRKSVWLSLSLLILCESLFKLIMVLYKISVKYDFPFYLFALSIRGLISLIKSYQSHMFSTRHTILIHVFHIIPTRELMSHFVSQISTQSDITIDVLQILGLSVCTYCASYRYISSSLHISVSVYIFILSVERLDLQVKIIS